MLESLCVIKGFTATTTQKQIARGHRSPTPYSWAGADFLESLVPKKIPGPAFQLRERGRAEVGEREARRVLTSIIHFPLQFSFLGILKVHIMVLTVGKALETMNVKLTKGSMLKDCVSPWIAGEWSAPQACCSQIYKSTSYFFKDHSMNGSNVLENRMSNQSDHKSHSPREVAYMIEMKVLRSCGF